MARPAPLLYAWLFDDAQRGFSPAQECRATYFRHIYRHDVEMISGQEVIASGQGSRYIGDDAGDADYGRFRAWAPDFATIFTWARRYMGRKRAPCRRGGVDFFDERNAVSL